LRELGRLNKKQKVAGVCVCVSWSTCSYR